MSSSPPIKSTGRLSLEEITGRVTNASGIPAIIERMAGFRPSRQAAWRWVTQGEIPSRRISPRGDYLILKTDVEKFANDLLLSGRSMTEIKKARAAERRLVAGPGRRGATASGRPAGSSRPSASTAKRINRSLADLRDNHAIKTPAKGEAPA